MNSKHIKRTAGLVLIMSLISFAQTLLAADGKTLYAQKTCIACHGEAGKQGLTPQYPKLAGQNKAYLVQQLKDMKSGKRNNGLSAVMAGIMAAVSEEEMDAIAEYLSTQ